MIIFCLHRIRWVMVLPLLLAWHFAQAQIRVSSGEKVELSVKSIPNETYSWDLYDNVEGINIATTNGNAPSDKALFISAKTGDKIIVQFLRPGVYFYKVTASSTCSNNIKIGKVIVSKINFPPPTKIPPPRIILSYNCDQGITTLKAVDTRGELLWSTGENTETIEVDESGTYTAVNIVGGETSSATTIKVENIIPNRPIDILATPPKIEKGGISLLEAEGCENGELHWFADKELTKELYDTEVSPKETTTYYVVCRNEFGCQGEAASVTVVVDSFDKNVCKELYKSITIEQLITPNTDGYNDTWELVDLLKYCKVCGKTAMVRLYNRWGAKVYEKDGYMLDDERFEGYSENILDYKNSDLLPSGTYFYIIVVEGEKEKTGFINIVTEKN